MSSSNSWPNFPQTSAPVPTPNALLPLIYKDTRPITRLKKANAATRNPVYRLWLADAPEPIIIKWFLPELDPFFDSRYRREEKILWLLNRWFGARVPTLYGGLIKPTFALLAEQDVGRQTLDDRLAATADEAEKFEIALAGIKLLAEFHQVCQRHYTVFHRTCYSVDLDRLTLKTYLRRARIALGRLWLLEDVRQKKIAPAQALTLKTSQLEAQAVAHLGHTFFQWYTQAVLKPLRQAPRQIIHNSFSPFHLIWNSHWALIDFETMSVGAAQIDLAEFIGAPTMTFSTEQQQTLVEHYCRLKDDNPQSPDPDFMAGYHCALVTRSLDYLGVAALRCIKYMAEQKTAQVSLYRNRATQYQLRLVTALTAINQTLPITIPDP